MEWFESRIEQSGWGGFIYLTIPILYSYLIDWASSVRQPFGRVVTHRGNGEGVCVCKGFEHLQGKILMKVKMWARMWDLLGKTFQKKS